jgi:DNA polymerase III sliding clamp (beta) subunit (PCNA family)
MTLTFNKSELAKTLGVFSPYFTKGCPLSLRVVKGGILDMFTTSFVANGSVLAHVSCNKTEKATPWMHVDGPTLQSLVTLADDGPISIEIGKDELTLKYASTTNKLRFLSSSWPSYESDVKFGNPTAAITVSDLNTLTLMTEAASTEEARPDLRGIYIAASEHKLEAATTDGFAMSSVSLNLKGDLESSGAMYAIKALGRAKRAITKAAADYEEVKIGFHTSGITLSMTRDNAEYLFDVPKTTGKFPNYKAVLETMVVDGIKIDVSTDAFASFLKRANAINGNVLMQAVGGFLWLMVQNDKDEQSIDSIPVVEKGESALMLHSHSLLNDALKACAPNVKIALTFPKNNRLPILFEGTARVFAMPLSTPPDVSPFKNRQPTLV